MKYLRHLLTFGLLLGSAALFAQAGESGVTSARLAERFLQEHPEYVKLFVFDKASGTARCKDEAAWASFEEFKSTFPATTLEDSMPIQQSEAPGIEDTTEPLPSSSKRSRSATLEQRSGTTNRRAP